MSHKESPPRFTRKQSNGSPLEREDWLSLMHDWRSDNRRALAKITRIQAMFLHLDADLEASFHELIEQLGEDFRADDRSHEELHQENRQNMQARETELISVIRFAREQQDQAIDTFERLLLKLESAQQEFNRTLPETPPRPDDPDPVEEASWESFPASDAPSFNPGRA